MINCETNLMIFKGYLGTGVTTTDNTLWNLDLDNVTIHNQNVKALNSLILIDSHRNSFNARVRLMNSFITDNFFHTRGFLLSGT